MPKERLYCNSCRSDTWHDTVCHHEHERHNHLWGYPQAFVSEVFKCCGCEDVTFRLTKAPFEFQDEKDQPESTLYPARAHRLRSRKFYAGLPHMIQSLYQETIAAHNNDLILLSTVGLRSLIEVIVSEKIDQSLYGKTLHSKIEALRAHFPDSVVSILHEFRRMGNKAAHEIEAPDAINIHHALFVVEGILDYFYDIESNAETFRQWRDEEPIR